MKKWVARFIIVTTAGTTLALIMLASLSPWWWAPVAGLAVAFGYLLSWASENWNG